MGRKDRAAEQLIPLRPESAPRAPAAGDRDYLQIGEVAELTGLTQRTLRYYEELQLLDPPTRMAGGFRLYSPADVARVQHIVRLKEFLGFSLAEIRQIVGAEEAQDRWQGGGESLAGGRQRLAQLDGVIGSTAAQLDLLARKIGQMELLRDELTARLRRLEAKREVLRAEHEGAQLHAASEYS